MSELETPSPGSHLGGERASLLARFFLAPTDGSPAALFRIFLGMIATWQSLGIWLNLERYWGPAGMIPFELVSRDPFIRLSILSWAPQSLLLLKLVAALFSFASVALLLGLKPRVATLLLAYLHISLQHRNPFILNSGDRLFAIVLALATLMPLASRLSVDGWLRAKRGLAARTGIVWGQRMVGLQIAWVYLASVIEKLAYARWREGVALREVLASPLLTEWPLEVRSTPLLWLMTYGTLLFETAFPLAIWWKRARPYLIAFGVLFHLSIDVLMVIPIFSYLMISCYAVFLSDAEANALLRRFTKLFHRAEAS